MGRYLNETTKVDEDQLGVGGATNVRFAAAQPVTVSNPTGTAQRAATNRSGTLAAANTAQNIAAANAARLGFEVQNTSAADLWINELGAATVAGSSRKLVAGAYWTPDKDCIPTGAISVIGGTLGQSFMAREW